MTARRALAASVVSGLAAQGVSFLAPLATLPIFLSQLGETAFGVWVTAVSMTALLAFLDFGIYSALLTGLSRSNTSDGEREFRQILAAGYAVLTVTAAAGALSVFLVSIAIASDDRNNLVTTIVMCAFFLSLPANVILRVLYAQRKIILCNALQALSAILIVIACYTAAAMQAPEWVLICCYSFIPVALSAAATFVFFERNKKLRPRRDSWSKINTLGLLQRGSLFFILSILTAIGQNCDLLIISTVSGPEAAANYAVPARVGSVLGLIVSQLFMPLWTFNGAALARGDLRWVQKTAFRMSLGGAAFTLLLGGALTLLSDTIMSIWMSRTFVDQAKVIAGLTAFSAVVALTAPYNMILNAQGLASAQITPWVLFLLSSAMLKVLLAGSGYVWLIPFAGCLCYAATISPLITRAARSSLDR